MNDISGAHQPTHVSFLFPFDSNSSFLSQNLNLLKPTSITLERGARYRAYAELRESKLQFKHKLYQQQEEEEVQEPVISTPTPPRKRVTFQGGGGVSKIGGGVSMVARSVPDFSAALRKENRKPVSKFETTPPSLKNSSSMKASRLVGSKSVGGSGGKGIMGRKSYASLEELKGLGSCVSSAINGASKGGGRTTRSQTQKTILGCRQY